MSKHTRREFEWNLSLSTVSYSQVEVKVTLAPKEFAYKPDQSRKADLLQCALFLENVAYELRHMAEGVIEEVEDNDQ